MKNIFISILLTITLLLSGCYDEYGNPLDIDGKPVTPDSSRPIQVALSGANFTGPAGATGATGATGANGTSFNWRGEHQYNVMYYKNDVVYSDNVSYIFINALAEEDTVPPSEKPWNWEIMVSGGATGATGATGANGTALLTSAKVYITTNITTTNATFMSITFSSEEWDDYNYHSDNDSELIVSQNGTYLIQGQIEFGIASSLSELDLAIFKNEQKITEVSQRIGAGFGIRTFVVAISRPIIGDSYTLRYKNNSGASVIVAGQYNTYLIISRISD